MRNLEEARAFFQNDRYAMVTTGIQIEAVDDRYAKCSMEIGPHLQNATGHVMGGAIYTLADFVFAVATNTPESVTVTTVSQITYLGTPKGHVLYGESHLLKDGKRNCFYEIRITDDLGTSVAVVSTSGAHLK